MARGKGFQSIAAFKKGSTWGTAVAAGSLDGIYATEISFPDGGLGLIENNLLTGQATQAPPTLGDQKVSGSIKTALPYEGWGPIIAQVLGGQSAELGALTKTPKAK